MRLVSLATLLPALLALAETSRADSILFALDSEGSICDDTLTIARTDLVVDGVTFDVTLTVVGSHDLERNSSGLGVNGTRVNDGETLTFSLVVSDVRGGTLTFDGFTGVDLNFFTTDNDKAELESGGTIFLTQTTTPSGDVDISSTSPVSFLVRGVDGTGFSTSFSIDDVTGQFTGVSAVPEPSTLLLLSLGMVGVGVQRRRRLR